MYVWTYCWMLMHLTVLQFNPFVWIQILCWVKIKCSFGEKTSFNVHRKPNIIITQFGLIDSQDLCISSDWNWNLSKLGISQETIIGFFHDDFHVTRIHKYTNTCVGLWIKWLISYQRVCSWKGYIQIIVVVILQCKRNKENHLLKAMTVGPQ